MQTSSRSALEARAFKALQSLKMVFRRSIRPAGPRPPLGHVFAFPQLDAVVEVTASPTGVVIRASRDCFSEERKHSFIRELAAEGFIGNDYLWRPAGDVRWIVDPSHFLPGPECFTQNRRRLWRVLGTAFALWLVLLVSLLVPASPVLAGTPSAPARSAGGHSRSVPVRPGHHSGPPATAR